MAQTHHLSQKAYDRLKAEHDELTTRGRVDIARKIEAARELGDLKENGDYHAAKDEQGKMEARIRQLAAMLENAEIVEGTDGDEVRPARSSSIRYEGDDDTERYSSGPIEERGDELEVISPGSPLGAGAARAQRSATWSTSRRPRRHAHGRGRRHPVTDVRPGAWPDAAHRARTPAHAAAAAGRPRRAARPGHDVRARLGGPPGAPTVLLLHGWTPPPTSTGSRLPPLAERYGVVAIDHRGHGRGIRTPEPRSAWPTAPTTPSPLLDVLGIERAIAGRLLDGRADRAARCGTATATASAGLVLCATSHRFRGLEPVRDMGPSVLPPAAIDRRPPASRRARLDPELRRWLAGELALTDRRRAMQAGLSLARFDSSAWISEVDVPHAVVVTTHDAAIAPARQRRLAAALPRASVHEAAIDHTGCVTRPARFVPALLDAIDAVTPSARPRPLSGVVGPHTVRRRSASTHNLSTLSSVEALGEVVVGDAGRVVLEHAEHE